VTECVLIVLSIIPSRVILHGLAALLYVHCAFFAQGLCDHPTDPLRGTYAPSILSGYCSAELLIQVMLSLIPVSAPRSKMAQGALNELHLAHKLFERAALFGGQAVKMLVCLSSPHRDRADEHSTHTHSPLWRGISRRRQKVSMPRVRPSSHLLRRGESNLLSSQA
jgi:hypothetical protein